MRTERTRSDSNVNNLANDEKIITMKTKRPSMSSMSVAPNTFAAFPNSTPTRIKRFTSNNKIKVIVHTYTYAHTYTSVSYTHLTLPTILLV